MKSKGLSRSLPARQMAQGTCSVPRFEKSKLRLRHAHAEGGVRHWFGKLEGIRETDLKWISWNFRSGSTSCFARSRPRYVWKSWTRKTGHMHKLFCRFQELWDHGQLRRTYWVDNLQPQPPWRSWKQSEQRKMARNGVLNYYFCSWFF